MFVQVNTVQDPDAVGEPEEETIEPIPYSEPSPELFKTLNELLSWNDDLIKSCSYTQTHEMVLNSERKPKYPPHHVRCTYVNQNGVRCCRGEFHLGDHMEPKT